jgi:hypothetical protein
MTLVGVAAMWGVGLADLRQSVDEARAAAQDDDA